MIAAPCLVVRKGKRVVRVEALRPVIVPSLYEAPLGLWNRRVRKIPGVVR